MSVLLNIHLDNLWINIYSLYFDNIWNNVEAWRFTSILSLVLLIFYKKRIRFFQSREEKLENDRNIFINSDLLMTENFLKEFLIELSINDSFHWSRCRKLRDFCIYCSRKENKYKTPELNESLQHLLSSLKELIKFTEEHFSEIHIPEVYRLYPDLKHDPEFNYLGFQEQLYKLCRQTENFYNDFRLNVKSKLSI